MSAIKKMQSYTITSPVGNRYVATYAGSLGDAKYFVCKEPGSDKIAGYSATLRPGIYGPVCSDYICAVKRARNIDECQDSWLAGLVRYFSQNNNTL